jgi:hypothetical protein
VGLGLAELQTLAAVEVAVEHLAAQMVALVDLAWS